MEDIFKALSNTTRYRIVSLLIEHELCVCQIEAILDLKQTNISRQLKELKKENLVTCKQSNQWRFYGMTDDFLQHQDLINHLKKTRTPIAQQDYEKFLKIKQSDNIYFCKER